MNESQQLVQISGDIHTLCNVQNNLALTLCFETGRNISGRDQFSFLAVEDQREAGYFNVNNAAILLQVFPGIG